MSSSFSPWPHSPVLANDRNKRPRHRHTPSQLAALNNLYDTTEHPTLDLRSDLAERLGMQVLMSFFLSLSHILFSQGDKDRQCLVPEQTSLSKASLSWCCSLRPAPPPPPPPSPFLDFLIARTHSLSRRLPRPRFCPVRLPQAAISPCSTLCHPQSPSPSR
jgi:hypothetical protein